MTTLEKITRHLFPKFIVMEFWEYLYLAIYYDFRTI